MIKLWGKRASPFIQSLHSAFAVGTLIAPLIVEPFLKREEEDVAVELTHFNQSQDNSTITEVPYRMYFPYAIGSVFIWTNCTGFLIMYLTNRMNFSDAIPQPEIDEIKPRETTFRFKTAVVIIGMIMSAMASGLDLTTGSYLTTFAVKSSLKLSKSTGSFITSAYWGCFMVGRLISIPLSSVTSPINMLLTNVILCNVSGVILGVWSDTNEWAIWSGSAIMGLGVSSMSPNVLMWMKSCGAQSARHVSLYVVSAFTGVLSLPLIIGPYMDTVPTVFTSTELACTVVSAVGIVFCYATTYNYNKNKPNSKPEGEICL